MNPAKRRALYNRVKAATVAICARDDAGKYQPFGTGFNIDPRGIVVTCGHVIAATLVDGLPHPAEGSGDVESRWVDQREWFCVFTVENDDGVFLRALRASFTIGLYDHDLAAARLRRPEDLEALPFVETGDSDLAEEGEPVFTCGFPLGGRLQTDAPTGSLFARGILAGVRPYRTKKPRSRFLLDLNVNEGNSGGALVSEEAQRVVGVLNAKLHELDGEETGISSAVPLNLLSASLAELKNSVDG